MIDSLGWCECWGELGRVAQELGVFGFIVRAMSPIAFAQETVKRYNLKYGKSHPLPNTADDFLDFGRQTGYVTVLES
jgi:hypothetical protein